MQERRGRRRSRSSQQATIAWGTISTLKCVVRDFSVKGARLELMLPINVPDAFGLLIDGEPPALPCRVKWREQRGKNIGVEFDLQRHSHGRPIVREVEG
jgi:hypothetical protein